MLIVEILSHENAVRDDKAASYFFHDLAQANGSPEDKSQFMPLSETPKIASELPENAVICGGTGRQWVAQGRDTDIGGNPRNITPKGVRIDLCAIRLPSVATDILVTLSSPEENFHYPIDKMHDLFIQIVHSIRIVDWTLFG